MIEVLTTAKINDEEITLFGTLNEHDSSIALKCHAGTEIRDIIYHRPTDIQVIDMSGDAYSVYRCKFSGDRLSFGVSAVSELTGSFFRAIKETKIAQNYDTVSFRFKGIEKFFPLESFVTTEGNKDGEYSISTGEKRTVTHCFQDGTVVSVDSRYNGTLKSETLYNLNISQSKNITIVVPSKRTPDELLVMVSRVKQYFEFICDQELLLEKVWFHNSDTQHIHSELVSDAILLPKTYIKPLKENPYRGTQDELMRGLEAWMSSYEGYIEVFSIWEKTIYNVNVAQEDLFIWRCQAFELFSTLETDIYEKAKTKMEKNQREPNLKNFLSSVSCLYDISPRLHQQYFADVKHVRDKLTHHNPRKNITEDQKKNSYNLIKYYLTSVLAKKFGISGISLSLCLSAHSTQANAQ